MSFLLRLRGVVGEHRVAIFRRRVAREASLVQPLDRQFVADLRAQQVALAFSMSKIRLIDRCSEHGANRVSAHGEFYSRRSKLVDIDDRFCEGFGSFLRQIVSHAFHTKLFGSNRRSSLQTRYSDVSRAHEDVVFLLIAPIALW
jgi:hypothetical protein